MGLIPKSGKDKHQQHIGPQSLQPGEETSKSFQGDYRGLQDVANQSPQVAQYKSMKDGISNSSKMQGQGYNFPAQMKPASPMQRQEEPKVAEAKPAKLHVHTDLDNPQLGMLDQLNTGQVGHSWVSLEWKDPKAVPGTIQEDHRKYLERGGTFADPMGFWPKMFGAYDAATEEWSTLPAGERVGYSSNPFKSYVPGQMLHPDNKHTPVASQSYDITEGQAMDVINYAESKRGADYSVFFYNCTTFAKEAAEVAGQKAPGSGIAGICYPKKLYESIKSKHKKGEEGASLNIENLQQRFMSVKFRALAMELAQSGRDVQAITEQEWIALMSERGFEAQIQEEVLDELQTGKERRARRRERNNAPKS